MGGGAWIEVGELGTSTTCAASIVDGMSEIVMILVEVWRANISDVVSDQEKDFVMSAWDI